MALQYKEKKGDIRENENHQKNNKVIGKIVYVYEGVEKESPKSKRHHLVKPHYFCGINSGKGNEAFWDEVYEYMDSHYELSKVKKIYVNSDGGSWIKTGIKRIEGATHVLDEFHLEEHLTKLSSHLKDSQGDAKDRMRAIIRHGRKKEFQEYVCLLKGYLESEEGLSRMEQAEKYIMSNWTAARLRLKHQDGVRGSSTEGHVSHILSSRMSSRPMGWSMKGASKMAQLRAYYVNGGGMLDLVRSQKKKKSRQ